MYRETPLVRFLKRKFATNRIFLQSVYKLQFVVILRSIIDVARLQIKGQHMFTKDYW